MQLTDRISEHPLVVNGKVTEEKVGFSTPAFSAAINLLKQIEPVTPKLTIELENKMLEKIGFGFYDIKQAFRENLSGAYDQTYIKIFDAYLSTLDKNIQAGVPVSFFGSNGSGKTNGMATMAREIMRRKFDPSLGVDGRVSVSMLCTTCYSMIEDYLENQLGSDNIYSVVRLLMIDDIDRDYTGHRRAAFQFIINERSRQQGKPFFITTAMTNGEFAAQFPHVFSRMKNGIILQTKNNDIRSLRK